MLTVEFRPRLPVASYYDPAGAIVVSWAHWVRLDVAARVELLAREAAQHVLAAIYPARPRGWRLINAAKQEERGRRLALRTLVDDDQVLRAGLDVVQWPYELAERWGRSPEWCEQRVRLWRLQHGDIAPHLGPV